MAIKTFTTGEVLTSSDTNTYLANSGLVYVKSQTIGTSVGSVTVTGAFSTDYDNYKIIVSGGVTGSAGSITMQLNNSTGSTYAMFGYFGSYGTATLNAYGPATTTLWNDIGTGSTAGYEINLDIFSPFLTKPTLMTTWATSTGSVYHFAGRDTATVSNTGFTLTGLGGNTLTGGTIAVYGYRKA